MPNALKNAFRRLAWVLGGVRAAFYRCRMDLAPERHFVGLAADMPQGSRRRVDRAGRMSITVWRLDDGTFHATDDECTHYFASLREAGEVVGSIVTCSVHRAKFDVRTGAALCRPARLPLATYPVEVTVNGAVYVIA